MHRTPILFSTGLILTLGFAGATNAASTILFDERAHAAQDERGFMDEFAASALRSRTGLEYTFRHFGDLFINDDDRAVAGGGLSSAVTAAVFGAGDTNGNGFAFGGSDGKGNGGMPPGMANGFPGQGKGLGNGNGGNPGKGLGGGGGFAGNGGGGGGGGGIIDFGDPGDGEGLPGGGNGFAGGDFHFECDDKVNGEGDHGGHAAAIPLPPAFWIGALGLAAVGWMRRRSLAPHRDAK